MLLVVTGACASHRTLPEVHELGPVVAEILGSERAQPEVRFAGTERVSRGAMGTTNDEGILLGTAARPHLRFILIHELVHWHLPGTAWEALPFPFQEGLADFVACSLTPGALEARQAEQDSLARIEIYPHDLELTPAAWQERRREETEPIARVAFAIVSRIGLDRLRGMAERGETSPQKLIAASGISTR